MEGITGHQISRVKNKDQIELRVKWEGYEETTWEVFTGFVKDTAPMVERYLIKKSLMKPMQALQELKRLKSLDVKPSDPIVQTHIKELKSTFAGLEQYLFPQTGPCYNKATSTNGLASFQTPKTPEVKPKVVVKEVCCCNPGGMKGKATDNESMSTCLRKKGSSKDKSAL